MSPADAAWLANVRADADAGSLMVIVTGTVRGQPARAVIFPDEIVGKADIELLAHLRARLAEQ
ncbi:hypothetical protein [Telluria beijingensis]|uniref:hypothetical protein n=1 Tax=Telluria beijingensis TaxID=3068633 RepID=UPI00279579AC|nr:hypothetical protein [Massilia sp. REN29]